MMGKTVSDETSVTGSGAAKVNYEVPSGAVLGTPETDLEAVTMFGFLSGAGASKESSVLLTDAESILPTSCSNIGSSYSGFFTSAFKMILHSHVFSRTGDRLVDGTRNSGRATFGPGDHVFVAKFNIPSYMRNLSRALGR